MAIVGSTILGSVERFALDTSETGNKTVGNISKHSQCVQQYPAITHTNAKKKEAFLLHLYAANFLHIGLHMTFDLP